MDIGELNQENNRLAEENQTLNIDIMFLQDKYDSLNKKFYELKSQLEQYKVLVHGQGYNPIELASLGPSGIQTNELMQARRHKLLERDKRRKFIQGSRQILGPVPGLTEGHQKLPETEPAAAEPAAEPLLPAAELKSTKGGGYNNNRRKTKRRKTKKRKLSRRRR